MSSPLVQPSVDLTAGPVLLDETGRRASDLAGLAVAWRQRIDRRPERVLSPSLHASLQRALAPTVRDPRAVRERAEAPLAEGQVETVLKREVQGPTTMDSLWAHPDPRVSEMLVVLTTPGRPDLVHCPGVIPVYLAGHTRDGASLWPTRLTGEAAELLRHTQPLLSLAWSRVERDVSAQLAAGRVLTPLQTVVLEQWLTWGWGLREGNQGGWMAPAEDGSPSEEAPPLPVPVIVEQILSGVAKIFAPEVLGGKDVPLSLTEAAALAELELVADRAARLLRDPSHRLPLSSLTSALLASADQLSPACRDRLLSRVLWRHVRAFVAAPRLSNRFAVADAMVAHLESLPLAHREQWSALALSHARHEVEKMGLRPKPLTSSRQAGRVRGGALSEPPTEKQGKESSARWWTYHGCESPILWRVDALLAGIDLALDPLPGILESARVGTGWGWIRYGRGAELAVNLRALGGSLLRYTGARAEETRRLALIHLERLTGDQLASCSPQDIRPWFESPCRKTRAWAIQALRHMAVVEEGEAQPRNHQHQGQAGGAPVRLA